MKRALGVLLLGMGSTVGLAACAGEGALVGTNHSGSGGGPGSGGSAGSGGGASVLWSGPVRTTYSFDMMSGLSINNPALCLSAPLGVDDDGRATAKVLAVRQDSPTACDCTEPGRAPAEPSARAAAVEYLTRNLFCESFAEIPLDCDDLCVCEVLQAEGASLRDCQYNVTPASDTTGWCYVSPEQGVGAEANVAECPDQVPFRPRFLGDAAPRSEFVLIGAYHTAELPERDEPPITWFGSPCLPEDELALDFWGYNEREASVITGTHECTSGVCLVNHFRGRVSCPYGQSEEMAGSAPQCFQPGSDLDVTAPVPPQLLGRSAASSVICSCRCDGPGPGEYCKCPSDMECAPLIGGLGLSGSDAVAGSYCIPQGTAFDPSTPYADRCDFGAVNCGDPRPY